MGNLLRRIKNIPVLVRRKMSKNYIAYFHLTKKDNLETFFDDIINGTIPPKLLEGDIVKPGKNEDNTSYKLTITVDKIIK